ncbi:JAB domain-containing protein [Staphylococcus xylosus]|uniref:JAB domain-containing protein n=1 Tax=Staphylococcus xylosus TaxID=1288 RepID=UPI001CDD6AF6|nr:JAB domain-containing protein [Staphylococcus xylosus]MCA2503650.1 JAB domain-containing protein [Staphylococcus xylosus]MCE7781354.1 JAB domain-containing protein [Staphylococcus xylosus]
MMESNIVSLQMIKTDTLSCLKARISNSEDAAKIMRSFIGNSDREHLILICMNSKNEPTHIQTLSIGSINQTVIHPREIFKTAILSNANSIMLGHNHPSGDVTPSPEDINVTERLMLISEMMGILFYDHIIFSESNTYSIMKHDITHEV